MVAVRVSANVRRALAVALAPAVGASVVVFAVLDAFIATWIAAVVGAACCAALASAARLVGAPLVRWAVGAHPLEPASDARLYNLVDGLCAAGGLRRPGVLVVDDDAPNALSIGRSPRHASLVVTSGLSRLSRIELEGVVSHELAHVKSHDIVPATVAAAVCSPLAVLFASAGVAAEAMAGPEREAAADLVGVALTRYPPGLAAALERMAIERGAPVGEAKRRGRLAAHLWAVPRHPGSPAGQQGAGTRAGGDAVLTDRLGARIQILREL